MTTLLRLLQSPSYCEVISPPRPLVPRAQSHRFWFIAMRFHTVAVGSFLLFRFFGAVCSAYTEARYDELHANEHRPGAHSTRPDRSRCGGGRPAPAGATGGAHRGRSAKPTRMAPRLAAGC